MKNRLFKIAMLLPLINTVSEVNASDYLLYNNDNINRQSKYRTFNAPNRTPTHNNNTVEWFYNALNQHLSSFSEQEVINTIKQSMQSWSNIADIKFVYKGKTTNNINNPSDGLITVGYWSSQAYASEFGDNGGGAFTRVAWSGAEPKITEGHVILNAGNTGNGHSIPNNLDELLGLITHEVGHLLAIDHSDDKESIMSSTPYHTYGYQAVLRNDDVKVASLLYPSKEAPLTTVGSNLDIVIQSATFQDTTGGTTNIWAILKFKGKDANDQYIWALDEHGKN